MIVSPNPDSVSLTSPHNAELSNTDAVEGGEAILQYQQSKEERDIARFERNVQRMMNQIRAEHDFHNPAHGTAMLQTVSGIIDSALQRRDTDPVQQAIFVDDAMPTILGMLEKIAKWARFYSNLGPDEVEPIGADLCL